MDILIVEDNRHVRRTLNGMIRDAFPSMDVGEAADGAAALLLFDLHRPKLVLMDIGLPDANGIELTAKIKVTMPEAIVVIISSNESLAHREHAHANGASYFIAKNDLHEFLLPVLRDILRRMKPGGGLPP